MRVPNNTLLFNIARSVLPHSFANLAAEPWIVKDH